MTGTGAPTTHELPRSAWVLGWASLAGQVAYLAERGTKDAESALISMVLSALVVAWVSYGVLRARMVRVWFAGIILGLMALFGLVALIADASVPALVDVVTGVVAFVALVAYTQTHCFAWLRQDKKRAGPAFGGLIALAVVVGALGGLTASATPDDHQSGFHFQITL